MKFISIARYKGVFDKCTLEYAIAGFSVFDQNGEFIGVINEDLFLYSETYEHKEAVLSKLKALDIPVYSYEKNHADKIEEIESLLP